MSFGTKSAALTFKPVEGWTNLRSFKNFVNSMLAASINSLSEFSGKIYLKLLFIPVTAYLCAMLNRVVVILLIVSLIASGFSRFFIYAGFELNRKYIAENLCVNKNKPWLHCNGKCYFMRKIKEAQEKEQSNEAQSQKNLFQEAFFIKKNLIKFHTQLLEVMALPGNRIDLPRICIPIFQPPKLG